MNTAEADELAVAPKTIVEPIIWELHHRTFQRYRFKARVYGGNYHGSLFLVGTVAPESWSIVLIALIAGGVVRLRRISKPHEGHVNPDGSRAHPEHKHRWTDTDDEMWTYQPDDIRWDDHNTALVDFLAECNITLLDDPPHLELAVSPGSE